MKNWRRKMRKRVIAFFVALAMFTTSVFAMPAGAQSVLGDSVQKDDDLFADVKATPLTQTETEEVEGEGIVGAIIGAVVGGIAGATVGGKLQSSAINNSTRAVTVAVAGGCAVGTITGAIAGAKLGAKIGALIGP